MKVQQKVCLMISPLNLRQSLCQWRRVAPAPGNLGHFDFHFSKERLHLNLKIIVHDIFIYEIL